MTGSRLIDLSHPIASGMPAYPGLPAPRIEPYVSHEASRASYAGEAQFEITRLSLIGNTGTYLDAPYHRFPTGVDLADLPLPTVAALPGRRVRALATSGDHAAIVVDLPPDLAGTAVLFQTGWDARWGAPGYWRPGPFIGAVLAGRLVSAGVALVGVDFWNVDDTGDPARPAHTLLLGAGIPVVEHLTGLASLPDEGFRFFAVPAPVRGAASLPVRAFAELRTGSF